MASDPRELDQIQRWMQAVITHPLGVAEGVTSEQAQQEIATAAESLYEVALPSKALSSADRLQIYANAYYARLLECLAEMFPMLVYAVGEKAFHDFAFGYLQSYPSHSYTLGKLADRFADYLAESRPPREGDDLPDWADFVIDLARLEWAIDEVFDAEGVEGEPLLSAEDLQQVPPEAFPEARLETVVCLRLLRFTHPVNDYFTAWRQQQEPQRPAAETTYLALTRKNYVVRRLPLSQPQFALLAALQEGRTVGAAIAEAASACDSVDHLADSLHNWFRTWSREGLFRRVIPPG